MIKDIRSSITPILSGTVAGLIVAIYYSSDSDKEKEIQTRYVPSKQTTYISTDEDTKKLARTNQNQLSILKNRIIELQTNKDLNEVNTEQEPSTTTQKDETGYKGQTMEEAKFSELAWWGNIKHQFEQEEYDPNWAPNVESNFEQDLTELATGSDFILVETDCRSISCSVTVEFSSYAKATEKFSNLLHHKFTTNCARQTLLPEPDRSLGGEPYRATFIFNCSDNSELG